MSFNIRYNNPGDGQNAWPQRKRMVASMFRFHRADLVGVQEALKDQIDDLETLLPEYGWCGVGRSDGKLGGEFSAIFYHKGRFDLLESSTFWLSETPQVAGSKGWDASLPRIVTWAKFRDKATKLTFFHFNTHFDHKGARARAESARLLLTQVGKIARNSPVVVTGDFNANESSEPYRILTTGDEAQGKLQDARYVSANGHHGPTSTFNNFGPLIPGAKIDYVFLKGGVRALQHGVLADHWDGRWPSDHLPVLAEVDFPKKQR
ncbi:MAG TPA: endonuclease/exonuclease/phosphatase family protein [Blastocatellia bacterium]|nr:endonuclease/exonuclease/phosphatase family protein [Blastocatellia bacterium]